jgi:hypothetical protein
VAFHAQQGNVHLEGAVTQKPEELDLRIHRGGHKVYDGNLEGADVLMFRPVIGHNKNPLFPEGMIGGQGFGNLYGHVLPYHAGQIKKSR